MKYIYAFILYLSFSSIALSEDVWIPIDPHGGESGFIGGRNCEYIMETKKKK